MNSMKRAVGYCECPDCDDFAKGVFLLNHGSTFYCPRCQVKGHVEPERGFYAGNGIVFKEVRVEYNFRLADKKYHEIAIIRDESLSGDCNTYTLQSPLIKTERRALKVAEAVLSNLNRYRGLFVDGEVPRIQEHILSFDVSPAEFSASLGKLAEAWEEGKVTEPSTKAEVSAEQ